MRIPSTKIWLAGALMWGPGYVKGAQESALKFKDSDFEQFEARAVPDVPSPAIFSLEAILETAAAQKTFSWTTDQNLQIEKVRLLFFMNDVTENGTQIAEGTSSAQTATTMTGAMNGMLLGPTPGDPKRTPVDARDLVERQGNTVTEKKIQLIVSSNSTDGSVIINDITLLKKYSGRILSFEAEWLGDTGKSYSRGFTVVKNYVEGANLKQKNSQFSNPLPVKVDFNNSANDANSGTSTTRVPGSATSTSASQAPSQQNEGGLATGAIIGIAIACGILGLLLILGAAWFLIRRRNQQAGNTNYGSPGRPYGTERRRTDELIAEKEASAGGADPSPHSPYSDDGVVLVPSASAGHTSTYHNGGPGGPGGSNTAIAMGTPVVAPVLPQQIPRIPPPHDHHHQQQQQQQQPGPYATHSERGSIGALGGGSPSTHAASISHSIHDETANRAGMGSPTAGRATPHSSLAPQYAHLVEEGMTEDEIRRLEDEERQLDAEIERAGRR